MDLTEYWIWWGLTVALCAGSLLRGALLRRELLGVPVVLSLMWLYFYGYLSCQVVVHLEHLFAPEVFATAQFLACGSLASLLLGWHLFIRKASRRRTAGAQYNQGRLWALGLGWMAIGAASLRLFASSGASFQESSAYVYMLYNVGFAGAGLCAAVFARRRLNLLQMLLMAGLLYGLLGTFLQGARRGPTFAGIVAVVFGYLLARRLHPRLLQVFGTLGCTGVLMLVLVESRIAVYQGFGWGTAFERISLESVVQRRALVPDDNEFVNHCIQIQANRETGLYQYGTTHLLMAVNWIPRRFWPDKPTRSFGLYPCARNHFDPGFQNNIRTGGAWGAVADTFDNYWYFCFAFWFVLGALLVQLFNRMQCTDDLAPRMHYLGLLMSSHWFVAQCLTEALVPAMFFQAAFWISFRCSRLGSAYSARGIPTWSRAALPRM